MAKPNTRTLALFVFAIGFGLLVLGVTWLLLQRSLVSIPDEQAIATVDLSEGEVTLTRKATMLELSPTFAEKIYDADKVKTGPNSSFIFTTKSGSQIRVDENSIAVVERANDKDLITVLNGQAQAIKHGGNLEIQNTHEKWRTAMFSTEIKRSEVQKSAPKTPPAPAPTKTTETVELSTEEQILKSGLDGQKNFFNRCFAKFLVQNPDAHGEVVLGFLLFPEGKAEKVKVLSTSLKDNELEKCLTSVVERSPFKRFAGEPISVTYPIKFE